MAKYCFDLTGLKEYLKGVRNHRVNYRGFEFRLNISTYRSYQYIDISENGLLVARVRDNGVFQIKNICSHLEVPITHALGILSSMAEEDFYAEMFQPVEQQEVQKVEKVKPKTLLDRIRIILESGKEFMDIDKFRIRKAPKDSENKDYLYLYSRIRNYYLGAFSPNGFFYPTGKFAFNADLSKQIQNLIEKLTECDSAELGISTPTEQPDEIITDRQEKINTADVVVHSDERCAEPEHNIPEINTAPEPLPACAGLTMLAPITRTGTTWPGLLGVEEQK